MVKKYSSKINKSQLTCLKIDEKLLIKLIIGVVNFKILKMVINYLT